MRDGFKGDRRGQRARLQAMWAAVAAVAGALLSTSGLGGALGAQVPVFRSSADLVVVHAVATEGGRPVTDLSATDFRITEDGVEREISVFLAPLTSPLELALVLDVSGSMTRVPAREATLDLIERLPADTCVLLEPFSDRVHPSFWTRADDPQLQQALDRLVLDGQTALYDAVLTAFARMRERALGIEPADLRLSSIMPIATTELLRFRGAPAAPLTPAPPPTGSCAPAADAAGVRRIVAVVTDGEDNRSDSLESDVMIAAWGSGMPVFALALVDWPRIGDQEVRGRAAAAGHAHMLDRLAEYTGGMVIRAYVDARDPRDALAGFRALSNAIAAHYLLGYVPDRSSLRTGAVAQKRDVEVHSLRRGVKIEAQRERFDGMGADSGAASDRILEGFQALNEGRKEAAVAAFDAALALSPEFGLAHYGRGIALGSIGMNSEALAAFEAAARSAPWLADLQARRAEVLLRLGDHEAAWQALQRAHRAGSDVSVLFTALQTVDPRAIELRDPPGTRIAVQARGNARDDLATRLAVSPVLAALTHALIDSPSLAFTADAYRADMVLVLELDTETRRDGGMSARGEVRLMRGARDIVVKTEIEIDDLAMPELVGRAAAATIAVIEHQLGLGAQD